MTGFHMKCNIGLNWVNPFIFSVTFLYPKEYRNTKFETNGLVSEARKEGFNLQKLLLVSADFIVNFSTVTHFKPVF